MRRDDDGLIGQWQRLLAPEQEPFRRSLDARLRMHAALRHWWRGRAERASAAGALMAAAELQRGEQEYERETHDERQALKLARRMLAARRPR